MIRLDIGGGKYPLKGYTNVDLYAEGEDVQRSDMGDLPYDNESVDEIYSSHTLEHVNKYRTVPILKEWLRVLKPGGLLIIEVPDLVWCCEEWLKRRTADWWLDIIFGNHDKPGGQEHHQGFTPELLASYLREAGFVLPPKMSYTFNHNQRTIRAETKKF